MLIPLAQGQPIILYWGLKQACAWWFTIPLYLFIGAYNENNVAMRMILGFANIAQKTELGQEQVGYYGPVLATISRQDGCYGCQKC